MRTLLVCLSLVLSCGQFSRGQSLVSNGAIYEPFDYPANTLLNGQGGWFVSAGVLGASNAVGNLSVPTGMPAPIGNRSEWGGGLVGTTRLPI